MNKLLIGFCLIIGISSIACTHLPKSDEGISPRLAKLHQQYDAKMASNKDCPKPVIPNPLLFSSNCLRDGLAIDVIDGKYGYVDKDNKVIIAHQYKFAYPFYDGIAMVAVESNDNILGKKFGYIDKSGQFTIQPKYLLGQDYSEGLIAVLNSESKYGFIDKNGNIILPFIYDNPFEVDYHSQDFQNQLQHTPYAYIFRDGVALVRLNNQWQFIDKQGNTVEYIK